MLSSYENLFFSHHIQGKSFFKTTTIGYFDFSYTYGKIRDVFWHYKSVDLQLTYRANPKNLSSYISIKVGSMSPLPE